MKKMIQPNTFLYFSFKENVLLTLVWKAILQVKTQNIVSLNQYFTSYSLWTIVSKNFSFFRKLENNQNECGKIWFYFLIPASLRPKNQKSSIHSLNKIDIYIYIYIYICIYIYLHAYIYIYTYICTCRNMYK